MQRMQPPMSARLRAFKQASEGDLTRGISRLLTGRLILTRCQPICHPVPSGGFFYPDSSHRFMLVENNYPIGKKNFPDGDRPFLEDDRLCSIALTKMPLFVKQLLLGNAPGPGWKRSLSASENGPS